MRNWQMLPHEGYNMLYAQDMGDESYGGGYNCEDDLGQYYSSLPCENTPCFEKCMICGGQFICDEFSGHSCEEKTHCPYCDNLLTQEEFLYHNCSTQDMGCLICGRPYEYCTCEGPVITPDNPSVPPNNPSTGGGTHTGGGSGNSSNTSSQGGNNETNSNTNTNNHPVDTDSLCVGGHYIGNQYNHLFKDSVLIPPLQTDSTTCVSTTLAYTQLWLKDLPVEKFDSIKGSIEKKFFDKYGRHLSEKGVADSILQEFIQYESGVNAMSISLTELKTKMEQGYSGIGTLVIRGASGNVRGHEIAIIGYDNNGKFICKDPKKMDLQRYSIEELETYNQLGFGNSIFYIEKEY